MMNLTKNAFAGTLLLCAVTTAFSQAGSTGQVGHPWNGGKGVVLNVRQIMARQAGQPTRTVPLVKTQEDEYPFYPKLKPNPDALPVASWPPTSAALAHGLGNFDHSPKFSIGNSFEGANLQESGFLPPDSMGAVSPTQVLVTVNGRIRVFDKTGKVGALNADSDVFWQPALGAGSSASDPRARFDRLTNRWILSMIDVENQNNRIMIAVSDKAVIDASTKFTFFQFAGNVPSPSGDAGAFFDFDTIGVDANAVYVGCNVFNGNNFSTSLFVIRKSALMSGSLVVTAFRDLMDLTSGVGPYTPCGVDNDDPNATAGYIVGVDGGLDAVIDVLKVSNPGGTPTLGPIQPLTVPTNSAQITNPTPLGSNRPLDAIDPRLVSVKMCLNALTGKRTLWAAHGIAVDNTGVSTAGSDRVGMRWYEIGNIDSTPSLIQAGTVFDSSSALISYWMGSIIQSLRGESALVSSAAGPSLRTSIVMAQRQASDALGKLSAPSTIQTSTSDYNDPTSRNPMRWGDYSNTVVDPADGMTVWSFQEIGKNTTDWALEVTKLIASPPATITSVSPNAMPAGQTTTVTVTGTSSNGSGFFDGGSGYPNRIGASFSGTGVTVNSIQFISATSIKLSVTTSSTVAVGPRTLTVKNPDGQTVTLSNALRVGSMGVSTVTLPSSIASGSTVSGTVTLNGAAPSGGALVALTSSTPSLKLGSASVTVAAGKNSANFSVTATVVSVATSATITAKYNGTSATGSTQVRAPELTQVSVSPSSVIGGASNVTGTVTMAQKVGVATTVSLQFTNPLAAKVPTSVIVAAGAATASFAITSLPVSSTINATVTASWQGVSKTASLAILPAAPKTVTFQPTSVVGGSTTVVTGTVTLSQTAATGGVVVALSSSNADAVKLPATVKVASGSKSAQFNVTALAQNANANVTVTAQTATNQAKGTLTVKGDPISSITLIPTAVIGGSTATVSVVVNFPAPASGAVIVLTSNSSAAPGTHNLKIAAGSKVGTFALSTAAVKTDTIATITATYNGAVSVPLHVLAPKLSSISVSPTTVQGSSSTMVTATIRLTGPAPTGGVVVTLGSNNAAAASLPGSVTIPAGVSSVTATVKHSAVAGKTTVTFTASAGGVSKTTTLTVTH